MLGKESTVGKVQLCYWILKEQFILLEHLETIQAEIINA